MAPRRSGSTEEEGGGRALTPAAAAVPSPSFAKARLMQIFDFANGPIDHLPPTHYEFEIACGRQGGGERVEAVYNRMMQGPALIDLPSML